MVDDSLCFYMFQAAGKYVYLIFWRQFIGILDFQGFLRRERLYKKKYFIYRNSKYCCESCHEKSNIEPTS